METAQSWLEVKHIYNVINHEKRKIAIFYFFKNEKKMESIYKTFFPSAHNCCQYGKIYIYVTHIELFAFLPALPAASPVLSYLL